MTTSAAIEPPPPDEKELAARARTGAPDAIAAIYRAHASHLYRTAVRITGSAEDAEDVVHDLFVGLPELLRSYEHRDRLGGWLRTVVVRLSLARSRLRGADAGPLSESHVTTEASDPWTAVDLERAIARLPDTDREVFVLRQLEGYSHDEVAHLLGISSGAARVRFLRALRRLRTYLDRA